MRAIAGFSFQRRTLEREEIASEPLPIVSIRPVIQRPHALDLTIYTRQDCCLCDEMKQTLRQVLGGEIVVREVDIGERVELQTRFGEEVPVLFINGRKAFKFRVSERELRAKIRECAKRS